MSDSVISLAPGMKKRLSFDHPVMDMCDDFKVEPEQGEEMIKAFLSNKTKELADPIIMGYLWLAKDLVQRFRAHWPEIIYMTDDLAGEAMTALSVFVWELEDFESEKKFFNKCQSALHSHLRDYINDNRSCFAATSRTNQRRIKSDQPLEYNYAVGYSDELTGNEDYSPAFVDLMDEIEQLQDVDQEQMRDLIYHFLEQKHDIAEAELSDAERAYIDQLVRDGVSFQ